MEEEEDLQKTKKRKNKETAHQGPVTKKSKDVSKDSDSDHIASADEEDVEKQQGKQDSSDAVDKTGDGEGSGGALEIMQKEKRKLSSEVDNGSEKDGGANNKKNKSSDDKDKEQTLEKKGKEQQRKNDQPIPAEKSLNKPNTADAGKSVEGNTHQILPQFYANWKEKDGKQAEEQQGVDSGHSKIDLDNNLTSEAISHGGGIKPSSMEQSCLPTIAPTSTKVNNLSDQNLSSMFNLSVLIYN